MGAPKSSVMYIYIDEKTLFLDYEPPHDHNQPPPPLDVSTSLSSTFDDFSIYYLFSTKTIVGNQVGMHFNLVMIWQRHSLKTIHVIYR